MYPASRTSTSSRGASLEYDSRGPSLDAPSSVVSDPFVDRSLYDPSVSSRNSSRSSSRVRTADTPRADAGGRQRRNPWSPLTSENGDHDDDDDDDGSDRPNRPGLPSSNSTELSRQISAALSEDLPSPGEEAAAYPNRRDDEANVAGRKRSESAATLKAARNNLGNSNGKSSGSSSSFLSQFRSGEAFCFLLCRVPLSLSRARELTRKDSFQGSGWFAPMVEPEKPLSREEFAQKEKQRIEKLKAGKSASRRPGLMKRLSSGLELSGFGGGGGGGGGGSSPTKR